MSPQELKKALVAAGFEVYRTLGDEVILADRVRDNLIMDSGVRVRTNVHDTTGNGLQIRLIIGLRRGEFPNEDDAHLFERVRNLASPALEHGFAEFSSNTSSLTDPADPTHVLDTILEVVFAKEAPAIESAVDDVRTALSLAKKADTRS